MYDRVHRTKNLAGLEFSRPAKIFAFSHRLVDNAADSVCGLPLHLLGGMGVGVQREARTVVTQGVGEGLHIHTVLQ